MRRGFTLVELSIVLVIIGLLIGGILVARSMIQTTRIQSFISQVQKFDIAVTNFQTNYGALPGDSNAVGCAGGGGNTCNNFMIEDNDFAINGMSVNYNNEVANFWPQLQKNGFMADQPVFKSTYSGTIKAGGSNPNTPLIPLGKNVGVMVMTITPNAGGLGLVTKTKSFYVFYDFTSADPVNNQFVGEASNYEGIPVAEAAAVDTKIDDGLTNADELTNAFSSTLPNVEGKKVWDIGMNTCSNSLASQRYYTQDRNAKCSLAIKMLSQAAD